jgi:hypothetical protein
MLGWVMGFKNLQTRRRVVSAEEGQDSFPWPTPRDAASLQLLIDGWWQLARSAEPGGGNRVCCGRSCAVLIAKIE